jgi:YegS/Rv2252/BmrU family lipid kinase
MTTDQTSPAKSVGVLAHSGKVLEGGLPDLRKSLASYGFDNPPWYEVPKSRFAPKSAKKLLNDEVDIVLVWGGDGMVQQAIDALAGKGVALGILPAGTANLFARNLDIPVDLEGAVKVAIQGERRRLDIGKINGEHFGVMAGAGLDALMIDDADGTLKETFGRMTYVWTGAKNVHKKPVSTRVRVDGKKWFKGPASCVLVANMGNVVGGIAAFPDATPDDGLLEIGVVTADSSVEWVRTLGRAAFGVAEDSPFVKITTGKRFELTFKTARPWELDGGSRKKTKRLKVSAKPRAITVTVPKKEEG